MGNTSFHPSLSWQLLRLYSRLHITGKAGAPSDLQGSGSSSDEKPEGLGHQSRGGGQGREEEEARGFRWLACHPVHDAAVCDGADHLERAKERDRSAGPMAILTPQTLPRGWRAAGTPPRPARAIGAARQLALPRKAHQHRHHTLVQPKAHLEGHICHGLCQIIGFQAVPVVQVLSQEYRHLLGDCMETRS